MKQETRSITAAGVGVLGDPFCIQSGLLLLTLVVFSSALHNRGNSPKEAVRFTVRPGAEEECVRRTGATAIAERECP